MKKKSVWIPIVAVLAVLLIGAGILIFTSQGVRYDFAHRAMEAGKYESAAEKFSDLCEYKDSRIYASYCAGIAAGDRGEYDDAITSLKMAQSMAGDDHAALQDHCDMLITYYTARQYEDKLEYEQAESCLSGIPFFRDSAERRASYGEKILARDYDRANALLAEKKYDKAIDAFTKLNGYKDSEQKIAQCREEKENDRLQALYDEADGMEQIGTYFYYMLASQKFEALGDFSDSATRAVHAKNKALQMDYDEADAMEKKGRFEEAAAAFEALGNFNDSANRAVQAMNKAHQRDYDAADALEEKGSFEAASAAFEALGDFSDSADRAVQAMNKAHQRDYDAANALEEKGRFEDASAAFEALGNFSDSADRAVQAMNKAHQRDYDAANALEEKGSFEAASAAFEALGDFSDSADRAVQAMNKAHQRDYDAADALLQQGKPYQARNAFLALGSYSDSADRAAALKDPAEYQLAGEALAAGDYTLAEKKFDGLKDYSDSSQKAFLAGAYVYADSMTKLTDDIAVYSYGEKKGIINFSSNIMTYPSWEQVTLLNDSMLTVSKDGKIAVCDRSGNLLTDYLWDSVSVSGKMLIVSSDSSYGLLSGTDASVALPCELQQIVTTDAGSYMICKEDLWGMAGNDGAVLYACEWEDYSKVNGKWSRILVKSKATGFTGVIAEDGSVILPVEYSSIKCLNNKDYLLKKADQYGLADSKGTILTDCTWYRISEKTSSNLYVVAAMDSGTGTVSYGLMKRDGQLLNDTMFRYILSSKAIFDPINGVDFSEGFVSVCNADGKWGFIGTDGVLLTPAYDAVKEFSCGMAAVMSDGLWGFIDKTGAEVIAPHYAQAYSFGKYSVNGVSVDNTAKVITANGETHYLYLHNGVLDYFADSRYVSALEAEEAGNFAEALRIYDSISGYDDAATRAAAIRYQMAETALAEQKDAEAKELFAACGEYSDAPVRVLEISYSQAEKAMAEGDYITAISLFSSCGEYQDAPARLSEVGLAAARSCIDNGDYSSALEMLTYCQNSEEAIAMLKEAHYLQGSALLEAGDWAGAETNLVAADDYTGAAELLVQARYNLALEQEAAGNWSEAEALYTLCTGYSDADTRKADCIYNRACALLESGNYDEAKTAFESIPGHKDSDDLVKECDYRKAGSLLAAGSYEEAQALYLSLEDYKDSATLANCEEIVRGIMRSRYVPGSIITLGHYEQNGLPGDDPVEWIVVKQQDDRLLLVSRYGLAGHCYKEDMVDTTWETSDLRIWLNQEIYMNMFTDEEKDVIVYSVISTPDQGSSKGGNDTKDYMFCLSLEEAQLLTEDQLICRLSDVVLKANEVLIDETYNSGWWWLRSPANSTQQGACVVGEDGDALSYYAKVRNNGTVRPAIWIDPYALEMMGGK